MTSRLATFLARVRAVMAKEFIQVFRDPIARSLVFIPPIVQTLLFGYAVTTDVQRVPLALHDLDRTVGSRKFVAAFTGSGVFRIVEAEASEEQARLALDGGRAMAVLRLDPGFGADLAGGRTALAQLVLDGTDSNSTAAVLGYAGRVAEGFSRRQAAERAARLGATPAAGGVELVPRAHHNENLRSRWFFLPGIIALLTGLVAMLLSSMSVVREKEAGTMEQVRVSPIGGAEFLLGKTAPFAAISFCHVLLIAGLATCWFGVPLRGSFPLLLGCAGLYLVCMIGLGLLVSTVSGTQQEAMLGSFLVFFPAVLLSGFVFPVANMPAAVRLATLLDPMRHFLVIVRAVFLKGAGLPVLWPQMAALAALGALVLLLTAWRLGARPARG